jgi:hypothetical protein
MYIYIYIYIITKIFVKKKKLEGEGAVPPQTYVDPPLQTVYSIYSLIRKLTSNIIIVYNQANNYMKWTEFAVSNAQYIYD